MAYQIFDTYHLKYRKVFKCHSKLDQHLDTIWLPDWCSDGISTWKTLLVNVQYSDIFYIQVPCIWISLSTFYWEKNLWVQFTGDWIDLFIENSLNLNILGGIVSQTNYNGHKFFRTRRIWFHFCLVFVFQWNKKNKNSIFTSL